MKIQLMKESERSDHQCFFCAHSPVKYRVNVKSHNGFVFLGVTVCNRCAALHMDRFVEVK